MSDPEVEGKIVLLQSIFQVRDEEPDDFGLEDMAASLKKGYIAGDKFMDELFQKNNVFGMDGNPMSSMRVSIPISDDPDFIEGFNAGVSDYMQGNVVEFYDLIRAILNKTVDKDHH